MEIKITPTSMLQILLNNGIHRSVAKAIVLDLLLEGDKEWEKISAEAPKPVGEVDAPKSDEPSFDSPESSYTPRKRVGSFGSFGGAAEPLVSSATNRG